MAGGIVAILKKERSILVDRWLDNKRSEGAKTLVRIMDLDDQIDRAAKQEGVRTGKQRRI
ncbi:MAG: hypothetical protein C4550_02730 [Nitrospiraceae bacterium]|nr:MAG: hypothetical protein C4550_02730 [Nitrospiraceae bacterium]